MSAEETQFIQTPDCHSARRLCSRGSGWWGVGVWCVCVSGGVISFQSVVKLVEGSRG